MLAIICLTLAEYVVSPFYVNCVPDVFLIKLITILAIGKPDALSFNVAELLRDSCSNIYVAITHVSPRAASYHHLLKLP